MLRVNWYDQEIRIRAYTSLTGDLVKLGTTTEYPFTPGGTQGAPSGWSPYAENGGSVTDVSFTTGNGRFSIGNLGTEIHDAKRYGIYRDFAVTPGKYYLISVQARTTQGRGHTIRYVRFANGSNHSYLTTNQMWTFQDWENITVNAAAYAASGILRVNLMACPYSSDPKGMVTDVNWGIQFQNVTINEQESTYPAPTWHEITCDTKQVAIHYGRDKFTSRYNTASATVKVDNKDSYYTYGNGHADDLRPGRFLRITLTLPNSSTELPMYYGIIDRFTDSYDIDGSALVQLDCIDTSSLLATMNVPTLMSRDDLVNSGNRFARLLDGVGWLVAYRFSGYTMFTQQAIVASGRSVRDECGLIADSEGGWFMCDRNGTLRLYGRRWPEINTKLYTVQAELLATPTRDIPMIDDVPTIADVPIIELRQLGTDWSRDRIVNDVSISNQDGTAFRYQNFASQKKNGPFTYQRLDFVNDNAAEPTYADQRATDLMDGYSDPILRVNSVSFRPTPETFDWCAKAFLEELVRVRYEHPKNGWGWASATHIQGYVHTFTPSEWEMSIALDHPESFAYYETADGSGWDVSYWDIDLWDEFGIETGYWDSGQVWGDVNYLDTSIGYVSTPDIPKDSLVAGGTYRLSIDVNYKTVTPAGQFPNLLQKPGSPREFMLYGANGNTMYGSFGSDGTTNVDIVMSTITLNQRRVYGVEWTWGNVNVVTIVDGVRTNRTFSKVPVLNDQAQAIQIGLTNTTQGLIYGAKLERIVNGQVSETIWQFDPSEWTGGTTFTDPRGRVWTLSNATAIAGAPADIVQIWGE